MTQIFFIRSFSNFYILRSYISSGYEISSSYNFEDIVYEIVMMPPGVCTRILVPVPAGTRYVVIQYVYDVGSDWPDWYDPTGGQRYYTVYLLVIYKFNFKFYN